MLLYFFDFVVIEYITVSKMPFDGSITEVTGNETIAKKI